MNKNAHSHCVCVGLAVAVVGMDGRKTFKSLIVRIQQQQQKLKEWKTRNVRALVAYGLVTLRLPNSPNSALCVRERACTAAKIYAKQANNLCVLHRNACGFYCTHTHTQHPNTLDNLASYGDWYKMVNI